MKIRRSPPTAPPTGPNPHWIRYSGGMGLGDRRLLLRLSLCAHPAGGEAHDSQAGLAALVSSAVGVLFFRRASATLRPPLGHPSATSRPCFGHPSAILRPPRPHFGHPSATPRPHLGHTSATPRPSFGHPSAVSSRRGSDSVLWRYGTRRGSDSRRARCCGWRGSSWGRTRLRRDLSPRDRAEIAISRREIAPRSRRDRAERSRREIAPRHGHIPHIPPHLPPPTISPHGRRSISPYLFISPHISPCPT